MSNPKKRKPSQRFSCCVVGCDTRRDGPNPKQLEFYGFPFRPWEDEKKNKWISLVNRTNPDGSPWQPTRFSFICSAHFVGNRKSGHPQHPSYLPTIFPPAYNVAPLSPTEISRGQRLHKRNLEKIVSVLNEGKQQFRLKSPDQSDVGHSPDGEVDLDMEVESQSPANRGLEIQLCTVERAPKRKKAPPPQYRNRISKKFRKVAATSEPPKLPPHEQSEKQTCNRNINPSLEDSKLSEYSLLEKCQQCVAKSSTREVTVQTDKIMIPVWIKNAAKSTQTNPGLTMCRGDGSGDSFTRSSPIGTTQVIYQCHGFHGSASITTDREMRDLVGVSQDTFSRLLQRLPDLERECKMTKENRLLSFLMRLNLGISLAAIGVLFGVAGITVGKIYRRIMSQLTEEDLNLAKSERQNVKIREREDPTDNDCFQLSSDRMAPMDTNDWLRSQRLELGESK